MKFAFGAAAALSGVASGQAMYMTASNSFPADGEAVAVDVVLDATGYSGDFYAWHEYSFNIRILASGDTSTIGDAITTSEDMFQLAGTESPLGVFMPALVAPARAWESGRRPGVFFPGNGNMNGGNQFGPGVADLVTNTMISSSAGSISGRQAADAGGQPEINGFIHIGRVYEVFRFQFTYSERMGELCFELIDGNATAYTDQMGTQDVELASDARFLLALGGSCVPSPGAVCPIAIAGLAAMRRRR